MVRASVIISSVFALAACVSAVPAGSVVNVDGGHHIGVNDVNLQGAAQEAVDARGLLIKDAVQRVDVGGHDHDGRHHGGLLGGLLKKREETPAGTIRIARAAGSKKNKKAQTA